MTGPRILIVLPYAMMARNFIQSGTLERLAERGPLDVTIVSPSDSDAANAVKLGMRWQPMFHPLRLKEVEGERAPALRRYGWYLRYLAGTGWRMALVHRFNRIRGFRGFAMRLRQSRKLRWRFVLEGLPMSRVFGFPFPRSRTIYDWLYRLYYSGWQRFEPVDALIRSFRPQLVVLGHLQTPLVTPYVLAAGSLGIPILGINGSWDQPTTKGPLCPGLQRLLVQNEQVREELQRFHDVPPGRIVTVGWTQMDPYADRSNFLDRRAFLAQAGYRAEERYVLFAANPGRLGDDEPEIAAQLAQALNAGRYGQSVRLHLRCHPNDRHWRERFGGLDGHPGVHLEPPGDADIVKLANLIRHAEIVVASAGSINLDAAALDTPTVGLAWENASVPYWDRQARAYEIEHLAAVVGSQHLPVARDLMELEGMIQEALDDRSSRAAGRQALRARFIEPLDGRASARVAAQIIDMVGKT